ERLSLIGTLCKYVTVLSERQSDFEDIANNPETRDLEDSLQMVCAENYALDYIVTRNTKDFSASKIPAIEPDTFINILKV
ncbi:MAG: PIN domain-containing protein, partial [Treponema sp.]|nr:PIN domain-containing protein [Treponema sp.]